MVWTLPERRKNSKGFEHGNNKKTQRSSLKWKQSYESCYGDERKMIN
jgi:hypothetical protein